MQDNTNTNDDNHIDNDSLSQEELDNVENDILDEVGGGGETSPNVGCYDGTPT